MTLASGTKLGHYEIRSREYMVRFLKIEPGFDPLRDDPRFKELLQRMKFPE